MLGETKMFDGSEPIKLEEEEMQFPLGFTKPEHRLIAAIIQSAVRDKDWGYFKSELFRMHCELLDADHEVLKRKILARKHKKLNRKMHQARPLSAKINE